MIVEIKVVPSSGRAQWKISKAGQLTCYLKSAPERGLANHELITMIARALKMPEDTIRIVSGQTSRNKRVEINNNKIAYADLLHALGIEPQLSLFK